MGMAVFELTIKTPTEAHAFSTTDFLQLACDVSEKLGPTVTGEMVTELLTVRAKDLEYLRVIDWNFEYRTNGVTVTIRKVV